GSLRTARRESGGIERTLPRRTAHPKRRAMEVRGDQIGEPYAGTRARLSGGHALLSTSVGPSTQPGRPAAKLPQGLCSTEDPQGATRRADLRGGPERVASAEALWPPALHASAPSSPSATSDVVSQHRRLPR